MADDELDSGWGDLLDDLAADVRRVVDRLRNLSAARLSAPPAAATSSTTGTPDHATRAVAAHSVAQVLADATARLEAASTGDPLTMHVVPILADHATGEVIAVTGNDLIAAAGRLTPGDPVGDTDARDVVSAAAAALTDVRRRL